MAGVQEKAIAEWPGRVLRIKFHEFREQDMDEVGTAHGTTRVARVGFFHHGGCQHANVVGGTGCQRGIRMDVGVKRHGFNRLIG